MSNKAKVFALTSLALVSAAPVVAATTNPRVDTSGVNVQPPYPASALPDRESGSVLLAVGVDTEGNVTKVRPVRTSGFDDLDEAAINGVIGWKFVPAMANGKAVEGNTLIQIVFQPPVNNAAKSDKPGVSADYISQDLSLDAPEGHYDEKKMKIPCANGSLSVTFQFVKSNVVKFDEWDAVMSVKIGTADKDVIIQSYPAYIPPEYQFVGLKFGGKDDVKWMAKFDVYPQFRSPTNVRLSWTDYGLVTATAANGEDHKLQLPAVPTSFSFSVSGAVGRFTNAQLFCTPPATN